MQTTSEFLFIYCTIIGRCYVENVGIEYKYKYEKYKYNNNSKSN